MENPSSERAKKAAPAVFRGIQETLSLAAERMPLHLVYELVLDRRPQSVLKAYRRNEASLQHTDRAHGELPSQDEREQTTFYNLIHK